MSHNMAKGPSGRIVLEIDPVEKRALYDAVGKDGLTLKSWFLDQVSEYLGAREKLGAHVSESASSYGTALRRSTGRPRLHSRRKASKR